jgi:hypothetical protein
MHEDDLKILNDANTKIANQEKYIRDLNSLLQLKDSKIEELTMNLNTEAKSEV